MASEFETALKNVATSVAKYVEDVSIMQVDTCYVDLSGGGAVKFDDAKPAARTTIRLDGDSQAILPMRKNAAGVMEVDGALYELHQQNVNTAIEYRARMLASLLGALQARRSAG